MSNHVKSCQITNHTHFLAKEREEMVLNDIKLCLLTLLVLVWPKNTKTAQTTLLDLFWALLTYFWRF
jgi:hypothetical protein